MPGMQFEYDEKGGTFYYFVISFYALILVPTTYYLWPRSSHVNKEKAAEQSRKRCCCEGCQRKRRVLRSKSPWANWKHFLIKLGFVLGWVVFFILVYKVSQIEMDWTEYDPFKELGVDRGATASEIKRAYRKLSLQFHPDRGGDERKFMRIAKAYAALTDETSRKNWEEHGNPDGPSATQIGIALPKWIIEKQNSIWVLGVYGLVFMIILPVAVGTWWYRTIKFSGDEVLLDTQQLFMYFIHRTPNMAMRRIIMILAGAFEFEKGHNSEIIERESDNEEVPALIKLLPYLNEKNREKPLCAPYSVKARALLHAHFGRIELPASTLEKDRQYIVKKCPYLVNEMVNITAMLVAHGHTGRTQNMPRLETLECMMKLSSMLVQGLWDNKCQLLQLPHIEEDMLRHFVTRKRNIKTMKQLVQMREDERRSLLRTLTEEQYRDVMNVCCAMPLIEMNVTTEVIDDEDCHIITAGSIVTVNVKLVRKSMSCLLNTEGTELEEGLNGELETMETAISGDGGLPEGDGDGDGSDGGSGAVAVPGNTSESPVKNKPRVWEKQQKKQVKKKGGKKPAGGKKPVAKSQVKPAAGAPTTRTPGVEELAVSPVESGSAAGDSPAQKKLARRVDKGEDSLGEESESDREGEGDRDEDAANDSEEDEGWKRFQEEVRKENSLETKERTSHTVHCPYYPAEKHEFWWVYLCDRKRHELISAPVQVTSLQEEEEVSLKFTAPYRPGQYVYTVCLRSDCYVDIDMSMNMKLDVTEARVIEDHPQWDLSDDENGEEGGPGKTYGGDSDRDSGAESDDTDYDYSD